MSAGAARYGGFHSQPKTALPERKPSRQVTQGAAKAQLATCATEASQADYATAVDVGYVRTQNRGTSCSYVVPYSNSACPSKLATYKYVVV